MSIQAIRFRVDGEKVVLQVCAGAQDWEGMAYRERADWRDAKVEDLLEVARYTRAYDSLDSNLSSLQSTVGSLQHQVGEVLEMNSRLIQERKP